MSGIFLTVCVMFLFVYLVDFIARGKYQDFSEKKLSLIFDAENQLDSSHLEKISTESYQSFYETLTLKLQACEKIDKQRENELQKIKYAAKKKISERSVKKNKYNGSIKLVQQDSFYNKQIYKIQLGSFRDFEKAIVFAENLAEKGYEPYILESRFPDKAMMYRVRIGKFKDMEEAQAVAEELQKQEKLAAFITAK
jgi:cell division protein FtsN